jgi:outer membrane receptor protein involved in Fe transport
VPGDVVDMKLTEHTQLGYVYWTPRDELSVGARYERARYRSGPFGVLGYAQMSTARLPIELRYFARSGLTFGARASHVQQDGLFQPPSPLPIDPALLVAGGDRFFILDAFVGYRLPHRRGLLSLNADNLLNERFQFQDIDPTNPSLIPERLLSFRFTLAFD